MTEFGVYSEVGKLRKVIVHRPDLSLRRLTPANHDDFLFDDVLWVDKAVGEHNAFVRLIRNEGVKVWYLQELLAEALSTGDEVRQEVIGLVSAGSSVGIAASDAVRMCLMDMQAVDLARHLIGGLTVGELECIYMEGLARSSLTAAIAGPGAFILPPLPNTLFTRDSSSLDRQRGLHQPDVLARPPGGGTECWHHLPPSPCVYECRLQVLVPATGNRK